MRSAVGTLLDGPGRQGLQAAWAHQDGIYFFCFFFVFCFCFLFYFFYPVQWLSMIFRSTKSKTECANTCRAGAKLRWVREARVNSRVHTHLRDGVRKSMG